jgi:hypothetical protein
MEEKSWEYCELRLDNILERGGMLLPGEGTGYDCSIRYYTLDGHLYTELSNADKGISYNPFSRAMAILGANGWELVSIHIGDYDDSWGHKVAFLKRLIISGRKVNEPVLKF